MIAAENAENGLVTKRGMAQILGVPLTTFEAWLQKHGDAFPVHERGSRGVGWKFRPEDVVAFVAQAKAETGGGGATTSSIAARIQAERLRKLELENRQAEGELIRADQVQSLMADAFAEVSRGMRDFLRLIARENGWPEAILNANESRMAEVQRGIVDRLSAALGSGATNGARTA